MLKTLKKIARRMISCFKDQTAPAETTAEQTPLPTQASTAQAMPEPIVQPVPEPIAQAIPEPEAQAIPELAAQAMPEPEAQAERTGITLIEVMNRQDLELKSIMNRQNLELKSMLGTVPKERLLDVITLKDNKGTNAIDKAIAADNTNNLEIILGALPEKGMVTELLSTLNTSSFTKLAKDSTFLKVLLDAVPEEDRLMAICTPGYLRPGLTADSIIDKPLPPECVKLVSNVIKSSLEDLSEEERMEVLAKKEVLNGSSLLRLSLKQPTSDLFNSILENLTKEQQREAIITQNDNFNENLLDRAILDKRHKSLETMIGLLSEEGNEIKLWDHLGYQAHMSLAILPETLKKLLDATPEEDREQAVMMRKGSSNKALFDYCAISDESLRMAFELVPEADRKDIICRRDEEDQQNFIERNNYNSTLIKTALELVPEADRGEVITAMDMSGNYSILTVNVPLCKEYESFKVALESVPKTEREALLTRQTVDNKCLLSEALRCPKLLEVALESIPEIDRISALSALDRDRINSVVDALPPEVKSRTVAMVDKHMGICLAHREALGLTESIPLLGEIFEYKTDGTPENRSTLDPGIAESYQDAKKICQAPHAIGNIFEPLTTKDDSSAGMIVSQALTTFLKEKLASEGAQGLVDVLGGGVEENINIVRNEIRATQQNPVQPSQSQWVQRALNNSDDASLSR